MSGAKDQAKYWASRIRKRMLSTGKESREFYARLQWGGERRWVALGTSNKSIAAQEAAEKYRKLRLGGWGTIETKPSSEESKKDLDALTLGEFFRCVQPNTEVTHDTFIGYARAIRQIAGALKGFPCVNRASNQAKAEWCRKVDALPVSILSEDSVKAWRKKYHEVRGNGDSAKRTSNKVFLNAKALFGNEALIAESGLEGLINPFENSKLLKVEIEPYRSKFKQHGFSLADLILQAKQEWGGFEARIKVHREAYKCLILLTYGALRKKEADLLPWSNFNPAARELTVMRTEWFTPKNHSRGVMNIGPVASEALQRYRELSPESDFILEGGSPKRNTNHHYYRAARTFDFLNKWLRTYQHRGAFPFADINKPIHELRKEKGAEIVTCQDIYAAKCFLRHKSIITTESYYADYLRQIDGNLAGVDQL